MHTIVSFVGWTDDRCESERLLGSAVSVGLSRIGWGNRNCAQSHKCAATMVGHGYVVIVCSSTLINESARMRVQVCDALIYGAAGCRVIV